MKKSGSKLKFKLFAILLVLSLFLISGQQGCPAGTGTGIGTGTSGQNQPSTDSQRTGLDFSFVQGIDYLYSGKKIAPEDVFFVNVRVENSAQVQKGGLLCLRDNIEDVYNGVKTECKNFLIAPAVYAGGKVVTTGSTNIVFGEYKYSNLPISQDITLFATASYADQSSASASVAVPEPQTERLQITQDLAPFTTSIEKTVSLREGGYKVNLAIEFAKSGSDTTINTPDLKKPGLILDPQFSQQQIECAYTEPLIKYLAFDEKKSTNFISCSVLLPKEQISYPLVLKLIYGVKIDKKFNFRIEKEVTKTA